MGTVSKSVADCHYVAEEEKVPWGERWRSNCDEDVSRYRERQYQFCLAGFAATPFFTEPRRA